MKPKLCFLIGTSLSLALDMLYGGWTAELRALVTIMAIDFAAGLLTAAFSKSAKTVSGKLSSSIMWRGLGKKFLSLLIVAACHVLDGYLAINYLMNVAIVSFIANEVLSLMETCSYAGLKVGFLEKVLDILNQKEEKEE